MKNVLSDIWKGAEFFSVNMVLLEEKQNNRIMNNVRLPCILPTSLIKSPISFRRDDFYQAVKIF